MRAASAVASAPTTSPPPPIPITSGRRDRARARSASFMARSVSGGEPASKLDGVRSVCPPDDRTRPKRPMHRFLALAVLTTSLALATTAHASKTQQSIFQDDRMLLAYGAGVQNGALNDMQALGVDVVHADVEWYTLAPSRNSSSPPQGVDLTDPASYRADGWAIIDSLVRGAQARGMQVLLTPT